MNSLSEIDAFAWTYPVRWVIHGRVYERASKDAEPVDITDTLPAYEPCTECDVCDDDAAWE